MLYILFWSSPFKIRYMIVLLVPIYMVDLLLSFRIQNESLSNETMNFEFEARRTN